MYPLIAHNTALHQLNTSTKYVPQCSDTSKGQIKLKADCRAVDSPKKRTNEFVLFFALKTEN